MFSDVYFFIGKLFAFCQYSVQYNFRERGKEGNPVPVLVFDWKKVEN